MPFNIGAPELIIILVIALLILGPGRLPEVGSSVGKALREFRKASSDVQESIDLDTSPLPPAPPAAAQPAPAAPAAAQVAAAAAPVAAAAPAVVAADAPVAAPPPLPPVADAPRRRRRPPPRLPTSWCRPPRTLRPRPSARRLTIRPALRPPLRPRSLARTGGSDG